MGHCSVTKKECNLAMLDYMGGLCGYNVKSEKDKYYMISLVSGI